MSTAPPLGEVYAMAAKIVPFSTVLTTGLLYFFIWLTTLSVARRETGSSGVPSRSEAPSKPAGKRRR
jgi:hypothetical protein